MERDHWFSAFDVSDQAEYYPPRISRAVPKWAVGLPSNLRGLLHETYDALRADGRRLATMGARALVDVYLNSSIGDVGNFDKKLDALVSKGNLAANDKEVLLAALDAGHAAIHRGHTPLAADVDHVMDIVESLLQKLVLSNAAAALRETTPARQKPLSASKKTAK